MSKDPNLGYTQICTELSARFGTRFAVETIGQCTMIVAQFEDGIEVVITDCGPTLSSVDQHLQGKADGFYVGVHNVATNVHRVHVEEITQLGYACDVDAAPTVDAIGGLVRQALNWARFLREDGAKTRGDR